MLIGLKIIFSILIFVFSGGILGKSYAKHKILVILAGIVTLFGSAYLSRDICQDLGYCEEQSFASFFRSFFTSNPVKADETWVPTKTNAHPLPPLSAEFKATPFSSVFKFSFDTLSFEAFKKQQAFQEKKGMFETTQAYQARYAELKTRFQEYRLQLASHHQKLIKKYNEAVLDANNIYQVGVATLTAYDADAGKLSIKLDWQANWIKKNVVTDLIKTTTITIPPKNAKVLWESGQEKRLFFKVTEFDNQKESLGGEAVLVETGNGWFSANNIWLVDNSLLYLSPTDKGKNLLSKMIKKGIIPPMASVSESLISTETLSSNGSFGDSLKNANRRQEIAWQQAATAEWIRPRGYYGGLSCVIEIHLKPGAAVVQSAKIVTGSGNSIFDASAIKAVYDASPLAEPNDVYSHLNFNIIFRQ